MFDWARHWRDERPLARVPGPGWVVLALALAAQVGFSTVTPRAAPSAADLQPPPSIAAVVVASLGDPLPAAKVMNLLLQAHDNQPGLSIPFTKLDYLTVIRWLDRIVELDPRGPYPLLAASRLYAEVPDAARQRLMLDFVHRSFAPIRTSAGPRWRMLLTLQDIALRIWHWRASMRKACVSTRLGRPFQPGPDK